MHTPARIVFVSILLAPAFVFAQADGTAGDGSVPQKQDTSQQQPATGDPAAPADPATQTPVPTPTPAQAQPTQGSTQAATTSSTPSGPRTGSAPTTNPAPAPTPVSNPDSALVVPNAFPAIEATPTPPAPTPGFPWPIVGTLLAVLAIIPFGFVLAGRLKKKQGDDGTAHRCFDIKDLMEKKLKELTDVRAMLKEKGIEKGKEMLRDAVSGTTAGDLLVRAEKLEEQYHKLKALYEECKIDIDRYTLKGVLVENSLIDPKILEHLRVIRTRTEGERVLHDIRISKKQIDDIQRDIKDTKWYFHLWEPGKDTVTVVFKDKTYVVQNSDKSTWQDAIAHGVGNGIPESDLDFSIDR
jgi:cobalamin biosynthesis Mg chelatase CobN